MDRLEQLLRSEKVSYSRSHHPEAYTAQEVAAMAHVPGREMVKAVIVKAGADYVMTVLPATHRIDVENLSQVLNSPIRLATEGEMQEILGDITVGAEPPIGSLFGLPTYVDKSVTRDDYIVMQAGTHTDTIRMSYKDYERVAKPTVAEFAEPLFAGARA